MTGKREQPGSNDEFKVRELGTASVRRNGLAHERSRLIARGDGDGGGTALGGCLTSAATTIPARSTMCSAGASARWGHTYRTSRPCVRRRKDGTSSLRLVSLGGGLSARIVRRSRRAVRRNCSGWARTGGRDYPRVRERRRVGSALGADAGPGAQMAASSGPLSANTWLQAARQNAPGACPIVADRSAQAAVGIWPQHERPPR